MTGRKHLRFLDSVLQARRIPPSAALRTGTGSHLLAAEGGQRRGARAGGRARERDQAGATDSGQVSDNESLGRGPARTTVRCQEARGPGNVAPTGMSH